MGTGINQLLPIILVIHFIVQLFALSDLCLEWVPGRFANFLINGGRSCFFKWLQIELFKPKTKIRSFSRF